MTLKHFLNLPAPNQLCLICLKAVTLCSRRQGESQVFLYQLFGFYVEVYYNLENQKVAAVLATDDTTILDLYLPQIDISPLLASLKH